MTRKLLVVVEGHCKFMGKCSKDGHIAGEEGRWKRGKDEVSGITFEPLKWDPCDWEGHSICRLLLTFWFQPMAPSQKSFRLQP